MATDPEFVRLHNRLVRGMHLDLASGFGISGLDIVPFPADDPDQADHVRDGMRRGIYEAASRQEVESFAGRESDYLAATGTTITPVAVQGNFQEGQVQKLASVDRRHFEGARGLGRHTSAAFDAEQERLNALQQAEKDRLEAQGGSTASNAANEPTAAPAADEGGSGEPSEPAKEPVKATSGKKS